MLPFKGSIFGHNNQIAKSAIIAKAPPIIKAGV